MSNYKLDFGNFVSRLSDRQHFFGFFTFHTVNYTLNCVDIEVLSYLLYKVDLSVLGVGHLPVVRQRSQWVLRGRMAQVRVCLLCALRGGRW